MIVYGSDNISDLPAKAWLQLNSCGYEDVPLNSFRLLREKGRNDYQVIYVQSGWITARINQKSRKILAGECVFYRCHDPQDYYHSREGTPKTYWMHFTGTAITEILASLGLTSSCVRQVSDIADFEKLFRRLFMTHTLQKDGYIREETALLLQLLTILVRNLPAPSPKAGNSVRAVAEYLCEHYRETFSIADLADMASLSESRFSHLFCEVVGCPPLHYQQRLRLNTARQLLITTDLSVQAIAESAGYNDGGYFCKLFQKYYHQSPGQFRKYFRQTVSELSK